MMKCPHCGGLVFQEKDGYGTLGLLPYVWVAQECRTPDRLPTHGLPTHGPRDQGAQRGIQSAENKEGRMEGRRN
jgi:hypothetical protein